MINTGDLTVTVSSQNFDRNIQFSKVLKIPKMKFDDIFGSNEFKVKYD